MKKLRGAHLYTMVEILCVIFFLTLISGLVFKYYYLFDHSYRSSINNSLRMRSILTISDRWREALGGACAQAPAIENGKIVLGSNDYVESSKNRIIIHRHEKTYSLRLPEKTRAVFAIEKDSDDSYLIILNLNWKYSRSPNKNASGETHAVRIVSAVAVKHGDNAHE